MKTVGIGIIGGGLMGREMASAFARWCALTDVEIIPELVAVADLVEPVRDWFRRIPSCKQITADYKELLANPAVDVVYVAVPHDLHEKIYIDVLESGKDLFAEKPFGMDLAAAKCIAAAVERTGCFTRCSSEFPFFPAAQRVVQTVKSGAFGRVLEVVSGFHHSSDLDATKPANWKRFSRTCGEIGVLGDLGMHVCHLPLRFGWKPQRLFAQLQKGFAERPDGKGGMVACDTWDNAQLHTWTHIGGYDVPMRLEMKRLAPGETNTWFIEVTGTEGGVRYSTKEPKTLWLFEGGREQFWKKTDLGFGMPFKAVTGGIFEPGFPDVIQQMWAAFLMERIGRLEDRFGCATVEEAVATQEIFAASLESQRTGNSVSL
ncbi:MAG: Gfo/Idh/MocA family oxidoreductase [Verrucomicrobiaceae bacterium]